MIPAETGTSTFISFPDRNTTIYQASRHSTAARSCGCSTSSAIIETIQNTSKRDAPRKQTHHIQAESFSLFPPEPVIRTLPGVKFMELSFPIPGHLPSTDGISDPGSTIRKMSLPDISGGRNLPGQIPVSSWISSGFSTRFRHSSPASLSYQIT